MYVVCLCVCNLYQHYTFCKSIFGASLPQKKNIRYTTVNNNNILIYNIIITNNK